MALISMDSRFRGNDENPVAQSVPRSLSDFTWHGLQIRLRGAYFRRILARSGATRRRSGENLSSRSQIFA
ncbi:MAG: hypothetical protein Q8L45_09450, partial [Xanthomonadaceae bacterium]|nr:hypothetical protein [Xanthomonadaceae bacterium]MDP2185770.1 hypothetical protein [Xanthomonadales bacterium]MDZ4115054.1 hypothetical protein [Xanthomonadaceae bacterium]MDZ4376822.1 hypothetical protein [Xanthomonadaceae bacterium]